MRKEDSDHMRNGWLKRRDHAELTGIAAGNCCIHFVCNTSRGANLDLLPAARRRYGDRTGVLAGGSFADMVKLIGKKDIGEGINKVIAKLAEANGLRLSLIHI